MYIQDLRKYFLLLPHSLDSVNYLAISAKRAEKRNSIGQVKTKENANSANLPAIFDMLFGKSKYSTFYLHCISSNIHQLKLITEPIQFDNKANFIFKRLNKNIKRYPPHEDYLIFSAAAVIYDTLYYSKQSALCKSVRTA